MNYINPIFNQAKSFIIDRGSEIVGQLAKHSVRFIQIISQQIQSNPKIGLAFIAVSHSANFIAVHLILNRLDKKQGSKNTFRNIAGTCIILSGSVCALNGALSAVFPQVLKRTFLGASVATAIFAHYAINAAKKYFAKKPAAPAPLVTEISTGSARKLELVKSPLKTYTSPILKPDFSKAFNFISFWDKTTETKPIISPTSEKKNDLALVVFNDKKIVPMTETVTKEIEKIEIKEPAAVGTPVKTENVMTPPSRSQKKHQKYKAKLKLKKVKLFETSLETATVAKSTIEALKTDVVKLPTETQPTVKETILDNVDAPLSTSTTLYRNPSVKNMMSKTVPVWNKKVVVMPAAKPVQVTSPSQELVVFNSPEKTFEIQSPVNLKLFYQKMDELSTDTAAIIEKKNELALVIYNERNIVPLTFAKEVKKSETEEMTAPVTPVKTQEQSNEKSKTVTPSRSQKKHQNYKRKLKLKNLQSKNEFPNLINEHLTVVNDLLYFDMATLSKFDN